MSDAAKELNDLVDSLAALEKIPADELTEVRQIVAGSDRISLPEHMTKEPETPAPGPSKELLSAAQREGGEHQDVRLLLATAKLPQKIKLALFGNGTCRALLIRDGNRMVQMFVMKNPRLQLREVEEFVRNPQISEQVLRVVAASQNWMKSYSVKYSLVSNPKTPNDIALKWLRYVNLPELKKLAKSKAVPQLISITARKRVLEMEKH